jgi:2'-5' RNA ligase
MPRPDASPAPVQAGHRRQILGNQLSIAHDWGHPCLSYLLCIRPGAAARAGIAAVQDAVAGPEHSLLRVPPAALHISVAWLLGVHEEFTRPKEELWARYGPGWLASLATALSPQRFFSLRLRQLAATDAAVIAVAAVPNPVTALRAQLAGTLARPGGRPLSRGALVHTTLFRYGGPLADPAAFLRRVDQAELDIDVAVHEIALVREVLFPSLGYETIRRFTLTPG